MTQAAPQIDYEGAWDTPSPGRVPDNICPKSIDDRPLPDRIRATSGMITEAQDSVGTRDRISRNISLSI